MKKILLSVVGSTAIGKTKLAIALANYYDTEIISADSRQFYKEMRIGTAVPNETELNSATHHFIQHKSILDSYSVGDFEHEALALLEERFIDKNVMVMVGGSGLYVDAVTRGLDKFPKIDPTVRQELNEVLKKKGISYIQDELKKYDPNYYEKVDKENPHRLIRALEVCLGTGLPYSSFLKKKYPKRPFTTITICITADREVIYERINKRVDIMVEEGLLKEAEKLHEHKNLNALQTVGYKELFNYFDGKWELNFTLSEIKKNTRRFAKRQLTWFKKNEDMIWVEYDEDIDSIKSKIQKKIEDISNDES